MDNTIKSSDGFCQILNKTKWDFAPFYVSLVVYTLFNVPMEEQSIFGMILKCLPISALIHFVWKNGLEHPFNQKMFIALIFSCLGDAFLDFPNYFVHGTAAFAISQVLNILCFGFEPLNLSLGAKTFGVMGITLPLILPKLLQQPTPLLITLTLYTPCLITMVWRSIARVGFGTKSFSSLRLCTCIGAISFGISDSTIGLHRFYTTVPYAQAIIMATYYLAQIGIAMSVLEFQVPIHKNKSKKSIK